MNTDKRRELNHEGATTRSGLRPKAPLRVSVPSCFALRFLRFSICVHLCSSVVPSSVSAQELQRYETQYYILHTDVPSEQAREASLRMSRMAEEYHKRTRD